MAGRGPAPKPADERVRRNVDAAPTTEVVNDDELRGPELPDDLTNEDGARIGWPAATRRWWDNWRRSPQAQTFTATDWDALTEAALLHRAFMLGDVKVAAELRLRVAKFGATVEDRMRLRLSIAAPAPAPVPAPDQLAEKREAKQSRRARLEKVAGES